MTIASIAPATNEEWDSMVDACATAIYFQTREWFEIWSEYAGFRNDTKIIAFESGKKVLLPLTRLPLLRGLVQSWFLAPKGMGGLVTNETLDQEEKRELFRVLKSLRMLYVAANPYDRLTNEFDGFTASDSTQVLDLSEGFENAFGKWTEGHRKRTKRGLREGLTVELASSVADWRAYFSLYEDALARWGGQATNRYGWPLFDAMWRRRSPRIKLWLGRHQGQLICGALNFYHNRHVAAWHGTSSPDLSRKVNGNHVLEYHMIKDACEQGFLLYDFLPSSRIQGVIDFKSGFSPQTRPVRIYMSPLMRVADTVREHARACGIYRRLVQGKGF